jgi:hypothetical protein
MTRVAGRGVESHAPLRRLDSERAVSAPNGNESDLDRRMARLAAERGGLFEKAGERSGLSASEQQRLKVVERELDECFLARRQQRALHDARRFDRDLPILRTAPRKPDS